MCSFRECFASISRQHWRSGGKGRHPFAKIEKPVAADAELAVDSKSDMIIVNVSPVNAKNEPVAGSTPAVILLQGKTKTNIDKTMDAKKLPAGNYLMSVVSERKTASILFTIK